MRSVLLAVLMAGFAGFCRAQIPIDPLSNPLGTVDTVIVSGNSSTETYVILDEMTLRVGSVVTQRAIEYDRNRIYSLALFTSVNIFYDSLQTPRVLHVHVTERWYLFPVPILGFRDGDTRRPYYGLGIVHTNFRGRNQKVFASAVFGYDPSFSLSFSDPLVDRSNMLFFSGSVGYSSVRNKSEREEQISGEFNESHVDANLTFGRRLSLFEVAAVNIGYHIVKISEYLPPRTVSTDGTDRYGYVTINWAYDSRDLREYPSHGRYLSAYATKMGLGESEVNLLRVGSDLRLYIPLPFNITAAARGYASLVSGDLVPTYARMYFGYNERLRGYYRDVFEGENLIGFTAELRFPIVRPRVFEAKFLPLPREFTIWRWGVSLTLFTDSGRTWFRGETLTLTSFATGYGAGIDLLLPYGIVMRTQYAFDEYFNGEFILDFRTSL
jgi:outer membrane protein assembly factor BamA